jgi:hypothetical protein
VNNHRRVHFILRHNAHISESFAKSTNAVEKISFFPLQLEGFEGLNL